MAVDWNLCVEWLVQCRILPPDGKLAMGNGTLTDLAHFLKDGVALCQLLNRLKPRSIDNKAFSHRPQTSQYLSRKNIKVFLDTCQSQFGLKDVDLFQILDLFDGNDIIKVINTLYVLSNTSFAKLIATPITAGDPHQSQAHDARVHTDESDEFMEHEFVEEVYDAELNQVYDILVDVAPRPVPGTERTLKKSNQDSCVDELITTEAKYVETLSMLIKYFLKPLQNLIQLDDLKKIFFGIEELYQVHFKFSADLKAARTASNMSSALSNCFLKAKNQFLIYAEYCANLLSAQDLLDSLCEHNPIVDVKIKECQNKASEGQFRLRDMLAVPMQRVLKYHLLLAELIKHTKNDELDTESLELAHDDMKDLSLYINEVKRDRETVEQIDGLEKSIIRLDSGLPDNTRLRDYGKLLKDGQLQVRHEDNKVNTRYVFLFDRLMLLCRINKDSYEYKEFVQLQQFELDANIIRDRNFGFGLVIKSKDGKRKYVFGSRDEQVLQKWWDAMSLAHDNVSPPGATCKLHRFVLTCIHKPTKCDVCSKLLRGEFFQGYRCQKTRMVVHKECIIKAQDMTGQPESPPSRLSVVKTKDMLMDVTPQNNVAAAAALSVAVQAQAQLPVEYPDNFRRSRRKTEPLLLLPVEACPPPLPPHGCRSPTHPPRYVNVPSATEDLSDYPWFSGSMKREAAHSKLALLPDGSFVVRRNPENGQYALSVRYRVPKHIKIFQSASGWYYLTEKTEFFSIRELVEHFQQYSLESCFSQQVGTTLLHPYKTAIAQMDALAADKGFQSYCLALYDYAACEPNQLSISAYDVIGILNKAGDSRGWWKGYLNGRVGYFPKSYVTAEGVNM